MPLELRPNCEWCDRDLPPDSVNAFICSFECTYCWSCASTQLGFVCPNCSGELVRRPIRPVAKLVTSPASQQRVTRATPASPLSNPPPRERSAARLPRIIFLHGPAASGKFTIGQELSALTGIPLFHNHLTVDLLLALFPFGDPTFVALREHIWLEVMTQTVRSGSSLIFTFNPERTVTPTFPNVLARRVSDLGGQVDFVAVQCPESEVERRLGSPQRQPFRKLTSLPFYHSLKAGGAFDYPEIPSRCSIDSSQLSPTAAAAHIASALELPTTRRD